MCVLNTHCTYSWGSVTHQMTCVVFNDLEYLFFKSEKLSLKAHTLLQQLVRMHNSQSRSTQKASYGEILLGRADHVHSVHHVHCSPLIVLCVFFSSGNINCNFSSASWQKHYFVASFFLLLTCRVTKHFKGLFWHKAGQTDWPWASVSDLNFCLLGKIIIKTFISPLAKNKTFSKRCWPA